jgi:transcription-repair coupling factor (superfamily II helicase)
LKHPLLLPAASAAPEPGRTARWGRLLGTSAALAAAELARSSDRPLLMLAEDPRHADQLEAEIRFFAGDALPILHYVEWETLPWDSFSPHQDIISQRLEVLAALPTFEHGIIIAATSVLQQRLPPVNYVASRSLTLEQGQTLSHEAFTETLVTSGYLRVPQVSEHGEFAVRGSLIDIFPMGSGRPLRIDFFGDEIESLRYFSAETQLSGDAVSSVRVLPAREVPLDADTIRQFRHRYRERFEGQPAKSRVYREVSDGIAHGGIEYYLPLFFDETATLADYLPDRCIALAPTEFDALQELFWSEALERYELCSLDKERPILSTAETFVEPQVAAAALDRFAQIRYSAQTLADDQTTLNFETRKPPAMKIEARYEDAAASLMQFLQSFDGRVLFTTDSPGRREQLSDLLAGRSLDLARVADWHEFLTLEQRIGIAVAPVESGVVLPAAGIAVISEQQLFGERAKVRRRRRRSDRDPESIIRQLNDLEPGSPVVHEEYGIGRYLGLTTLETGGIAAEFLNLEYADGDKLYVPVHALDVISRYTGASPENAPLHRLGSDQWAKAKRRAVEKIRDVAAELLDVYARRAARPGHSFHWPEADYRDFESGFPSVISLPASLWIVLSAAMSDSARRKSRYARLSRQCTAASRWPYWYRLRCWRSNMARSSGTVLPTGRSVSKCCHVSSRPGRSRTLSPDCAPATLMLSSARIACCNIRRTSTMSDSSSSTRNIASACAIKKRSSHCAAKSIS